MNARRRKHILMFDSRGFRLQSKIEKINKSGIRIEAWFFGGANYRRLQDEADYYAQHNQFDIIYLIGGVNELTRKNQDTGKYYFHWKDYQELENHMVERIFSVKKYLEKEHPATQFVLCPMAGMNLAEYIKDFNKDHQEMVDNVTWSFNEIIRDLYKGSNIYVPDFSKPMHRQFGETKKNMYNHLRDGLHLNDEALDKWANIAIKGAEKN